MPYPNGYLYLTTHWSYASVPEEAGQFGMKFDTTTPATQSLVNSAAPIVSTMWAAATTKIPAERLLFYVRLAAIGADGKYVPGTVAYDSVYGSPVAGGGAATLQYPLQVAHVVTLRTGLLRGPAHAGRCYLPPIDEVLGSTFTWTAAQVSSRNNTFAAMVDDLNTALGGPLTVFSKVGAGAKQVVTQINGDTRPDVQRRRANQQLSALGVPATV